MADDRAPARVAFFRRIGRLVEAELMQRFPEARAHVGADVRDEALERQPQFNGDPPVDWVAFSFAGLVMWDVHVGVVCDLSAAVPTCHVGFHTSDQFWPEFEEAIETLEWETCLGARPSLVRAGDVREQQFRDLAVPLLLDDLCSEAQRLASRAVCYYVAVAEALLG